MTLNSPKRPTYWNSTPGFDFDHITAVDMSFCTSLRHFIQIGPLSAEKNYVMSISRWRISAVLNFRDPIISSLKSPVFEKFEFFCILATDRQTDKQTDKQMDSTNVLSCSHYCERRLNNMNVPCIYVTTYKWTGTIVHITMLFYIEFSMNSHDCG